MDRKRPLGLALGLVDQIAIAATEENERHRCVGVNGVTNSITIKPHLEASNIKTKIELALKRHAEVEANAIRVSVQNGNKVILDGKVDNWDERRAVENAAWSAPGVAFVEDHLTIR